VNKLAICDVCGTRCTRGFMVEAALLLVVCYSER
jgi:hypothetical protein